ncbi:hypothetical protein PR048_022144 [Dryococelus australis]|uniref:DDE-1 domain-containing protein n=1 Tax=Dryococelus australis TaxID=614101 RepID=A0ABQ9H083_9NEOP|nr:hypothetical protein PR048_022144 [Dryococelus australis]
MPMFYKPKPTTNVRKMVLDCGKLHLSIYKTRSNHACRISEISITFAPWLKHISLPYKSVTLGKKNLGAASIAWNSSFNAVKVGTFFDNLQNVLEKHKLGSEDIWNIDEAGVTVHRPAKAISEHGIKQVGQTTFQERGTLVTVCNGINAIGNYIPPFLILPRVSVKEYMYNGASPGTMGVGHPKHSAWMTKENFMQFLDHFVKHVKCSVENNIFLLLDNSETHISLDIIDFAKKKWCNHSYISTSYETRSNL